MVIGADHPVEPVIRILDILVAVLGILDRLQVSVSVIGVHGGQIQPLGILRTLADAVKPVAKLFDLESPRVGDHDPVLGVVV